MQETKKAAPGRHELTGKQKCYLAVKYTLDFLIALGALAVLLVPMGVLCAAVFLEDRGPVIFTQKRIGKDRKTFTLYKFRTMKMDTPHDTPTHLLADPQQYITKVGRFLRKFSLDELPQLLNILLGHMSLVGPRPALWNQYDLMAEREKYGVHQLRPGLTGWAQINGRDELEIPVKAALDGEYLRKAGLGMDIRCIFGTVGAVLRADGVVEGGTGAGQGQKK